MPPSEPKPKPIYISPDTIANGQPAADAPRYGMWGNDTIMAMFIPTHGYLVIRTHEKGGTAKVGVSILTEGQVCNGDD